MLTYKNTTDITIKFRLNFTSEYGDLTYEYTYKDGKFIKFENTDRPGFGKTGLTLEKLKELQDLLIKEGDKHYNLIINY